jgi:hypothetical protein
LLVGLFFLPSLLSRFFVTALSVIAFYTTHLATEAVFNKWLNTALRAYSSNWLAPSYKIAGRVIFTAVKHQLFFGASLD